MRCLTTLPLLVLSCSLLEPGHAQTPVLEEVLKLLPSDGAAFDRFGRSVAIRGERALIGAPFDDDRGDGSGAAYLFDSLTGDELDKLIAREPPGGDAQREDSVGEAVALTPQTAALGGPMSDAAGNFAGIAYTFDVTLGAQQERLLPFSPPPFAPDGSAFGSALAFTADGSRLIIGAPGDTGQEDAGANGGGGAAYLIETATGDAVKLFASDAAFADNFGTAVAVGSDFAVASSPFGDANGTDSGAAYLLDAASGEELLKLGPGDTRAGDLFGWAVDVSDSTLVVAAPFQNVGGSVDVGAVYVFDLPSGTQRQRLTPQDEAAGGVFGFSLALDGDLLAIGGDQRVFVYDLAASALLAELRPSDPVPEQFFGAAVDIDGSRVIVGAEGDETNGERAGAAYLYDLTALLPPRQVRVASIEADVIPRGPRFGANATVSIVDDRNRPVAGARVVVRFLGDIGGAAVGETDLSGTVALASRRAAERPLEAVACVVNVLAEVPYVPAENLETCDQLSARQP